MSEQNTQPVFNPEDIEAQQPFAKQATTGMPESDNPDRLSPVRLPAAAIVGRPENTEPAAEQAEQDTATGLRAAQEGWLKRRGFDPEDPKSVPRLTLGPQEYELFVGADPGHARKVYKIAQGDQDYCPYALVDRRSDDPTEPPQPKLMRVYDADFGTVIQPGIIAQDFQRSSPGSGDPSAPESPATDGADTYIKVDISDALATSSKRLEKLVTKLMDGQTKDPFSTAHGDIAVRAGDLFEGQRDAYVWVGDTSITKAVELTRILPEKYPSVCVVRGEMREAANGKAGMAQIDNPEVVFKIEGEALKGLQEVYGSLYRTPDFALTQQQRTERDTLFNDHVKSLISQAAKDNAQQRDAYMRRAQFAQQPPLRARKIPRR